MSIEKNKLIVPTLIQSLGRFKNNNLYVKREDLLPFSFGGNKARKALYFFEDIRKKKADCVITYGSNSSNHCRIVSNMAASLGLKCIIISPDVDESYTFNLQMLEVFGAEVIRCPISEVAKTIECTISSMKDKGFTPYFIMGGGHGNLGTKAYADCFFEILDCESSMGIHFDYIFHASGTGTTQAGLVCGKLLSNSDTQIIGISIARRNLNGRRVVIDSVNEYMASVGFENDYSAEVQFVDDYILDGYGKYNTEIDQTIRDVLVKFGLPLNRTYTGKAFWGMVDFLEKKSIENKNILFVHTGGMPLFFDYMREIQI